MISKTVKQWSVVGTPVVGEGSVMSTPREKLSMSIQNETRVPHENIECELGWHICHPLLTSPSLGLEPSRDDQSRDSSNQIDDPASVPSLNRGGLGWGENHANPCVTPTRRDIGLVIRDTATAPTDPSTNAVSAHTQPPNGYVCHGGHEDRRKNVDGVERSCLSSDLMSLRGMSQRVRFVLCMAVILFSTLWLMPQTALAQNSCAVPEQYATLNDALDDAVCAEIVMAAGTFPTNVTISRDVTIRGAGQEVTYIRGTGSRVLTIGSGINVIVENVTIFNGAVYEFGQDGQGGGIYNNGNLTLRQVTVRDNRVVGATGRGTGTDGRTGATGRVGLGGGIFNASTGTLLLENSIVRSNNASGGFGGRGGDTNFRGGNGGDGGDGIGGGIYNLGRLTIRASQISDNKTNGGRGGAPGQGPDGPGNNGNFGKDRAGGLYLGGSDQNIEGVTINGNNGSGGRYSGGILIPSAAQANIINSTVTDNYGALKVESGASATLAYSTIVRNRVSGIEAATGSFISLNHTILAENGAPSPFSDCIGTGTIESVQYNFYSQTPGCTFRGEPPLNDNVYPAPFLTPLQDNGGPVWTMAPQPNSPVIGAGSLDVTSPETTMIDQRGVSRLADGQVDVGAVDLTTTCFASIDSGETLLQSEGSAALQQAINEVATDGLVKVAGLCDGGTIELNKSITLEGGYSRTDWTNRYLLTNKTILDGADSGSVIKVLDGGHQVTIDGLTLQHGSATFGGGLFSEDPANQITIRDSTLRDNKATHSGGAIYTASPTEIVRSAIINNEATGNDGGGIVNKAPLTLINSTVAHNTAPNLAGGLFAQAQTDIRFSTFSQNDGTGAQLNILGDAEVTLFATILTDPAAGEANCVGTPTSTGYNRSSDTSCGLSGTDDQQEATIHLEALAFNEGPTPNLLPKGIEDNPVLDVVPITGANSCESALGSVPVDQRGSERPLAGLPDTTNILCDVGAVERGLETLYVCGPPLSITDPAQAYRCTFDSIAGALDAAIGNDTIVVSGIVTESVVITKSVTIRGPNSREATAGTHMGIVQAGANAPTAESVQVGRVFSITRGITVVLKDLNIRHGHAENGGGIFNQGDLTLRGVTLTQNRAMALGGAIANEGNLTIENSTLTQNGAGSASAIYNSGTGGASGAVGQLMILHSTLVENGNSAFINGTAAGSTVTASILASSDGPFCDSPFTSGGGNITSDSRCGLTAAGDQVVDAADLKVGSLRDNGGPTLTLVPAANSPAISAAVEPCTLVTDQRGKARLAGDACDAGSVQSGARRLTLCEECNANQETFFSDLQKALDMAMAGDTIAIQAGTYTGNFQLYKDITLEHAGIDVNLLNREDSHDVRAILQASDLTLSEQLALPTNSGSVLRIQSLLPGATTIEPSGGITVTLRGLTIQQGVSDQGGGIYNLGNLQIYTSTLAHNAARNRAGAALNTAKGRGGAIYNAGLLMLDRSTVSSNRAEYQGGAIYNAGTVDSPAGVRVNASTLAHNRVGRIGNQEVLVVDNGDASGAPPLFLTNSVVITSGDEIIIQNRLPLPITLNVSGDGCNQSQIHVMPNNISTEPLICTASQNNTTVRLNSTEWEQLSVQITVNALAADDVPTGHIVFQDGGTTSFAEFTHSILMGGGGEAANCARQAESIAVFLSQGHNLVNDNSCSLTQESDLRPDNGYRDPGLSPLQDNNWIDFETHYLSGYTYMHAVRPDSVAIDQIPGSVCAPNTTEHAIDLVTSQTTKEIEVGDIVVWSHTTAQTIDHTIALNDGEADVILIDVPATGRSNARQFNQSGTFTYRVYNNQTRAPVDAGTIEVSEQARRLDQRGLPLPQRGTKGRHDCDIGAYEYRPLVVGEPVPRPPSAAASATRTVNWLSVNGDSLDDQEYHAWSAATAQDIPLHPSRSDGDEDLEDNELVVLRWTVDADLVDPKYMDQLAVVEWPDNPQIHISGADVGLSHSFLNDGFLIGKAKAFEDINPEVSAAGNLIHDGFFQRTTLDQIPGDSYSVLQLVNSLTTKVKVVKTVKWDTPGVRDVRSSVDGTTCTIGSELDYSFPTSSGLTVRHSDPEGKAGKILWGSAYDGVETRAEQFVRHNTVTERIPPIHVRESRDGEIFPILEQVRTDTLQARSPNEADYDLGVAWYRTNARNAAWPVKSVAYRCQWPENPPEIIIASELGSEIGGQNFLEEAGYMDLSVYHQTDKSLPGYSPNHEHALLSDSNLGNVAPALYALRTDLWDRDSRASATGSQSYALLKYRDPREEEAPKIAVYQVKLTKPAQPIEPNQVTPIASSINVPAAGEFTLPIEVTGVQNLRSITVTVPYETDKVVPTRCQVNHADFVERPTKPTLVSDGPAAPGRVMRFRADLASGTNVNYTWDFGDGTERIAGREVSHVYGLARTYTVTVEATNGLFDAVEAAISVTVTEDAVPTILPQNDSSGCRVSDPPGVLTLELTTREKHGVSGNQVLADITFAPVGDGATVEIAPVVAAAIGPAYDEVAFDVTAGNPIFAPTPMRNLLDIQTCPQSAAYAPENAKPFWKDFKGNIWARAAGSMAVLYYYPLQPGFYMTAQEMTAAGVDTTTLITPDEWVGQCIPWLQNDVATLDSAAGHKVYPVTYHASWPDQAPLLAVGETIYERPKNGISGVAEQLAVNKIYDDMAPGKWTGESISVDGSQVANSLAQLIDPVGEVRVPLALRINDNNALPAEIKSERLLFGGGVAIVGTADNENSLPFSLRSRILFDDINGELIFRGYYDGASPNYLKGDPLLLLNVMSKSDRQRLTDLCATGSADCTTFNAAINALYHASRNPRGLDLCRSASGAIWPQGSVDASATQGDKCEGIDAWRDGKPDQDFLISIQDANDDGLPEPYAGLGKGKALSAGNAAGTGYVTMAYNNDESLDSLPVSLQVVRVGCTQDAAGLDSTYRGNVLVIDSDNLFDEKLTLRHTGDFGGQPEKFDFEWFIAGVDDTGVSPAAQPPSYPWSPWTRIEPGANAVGPEITIEGANPTTLADNWLLARYKGYAACGNQYRYSAYAGDPSAKPSEVRAQLAQGWIKRVVDALNPYDARVNDFANSSINTTVDMVQQAGARYEGPIPFSNDPETLNSLGLIESYQTILDRGRVLSIDSNINDQGANAALLNVTSRIADLYMMLANDAYADALDPTVGLGTGSDAGARASALFSFMNQFRSDQFGLIDEELALLRGRDETLGGVAAAPTYNRLTWNFSNGEGQVAYQQNYNVQDINADGFINEADAAVLYPQGHGDAWGHQLTAMQGYYNLLRHSDYTWSPRAEPVLVAGSPLVVDYYDERRFAIAAANKAKLGAEVVDLTYRKHYAEPSSQEYVDTHKDASDDKLRAWGVADWAVRSGQGAYVDWVVANAILPPEETRFSDVRKVDRSTVTELSEIAANYAQIQQQLDQADGDLNPLGLVGNAVLFDLDPSQIAAGKTHFEQVYDRAITNLDQTVSFFNHANEMKMEQRDAEVDTLDFVHRIIDEDTARVNSLIEIFGYPYSADIGVNGTYPEGYNGPDIYNYDLYDRNELTDSEKRCHPDDQPCSPKTETVLITYKALDCLGGNFKFSKLADIKRPAEISSKDICPITTGRDSSVITVTHTIGIGLDAGRGRFKPEAWGSDAVRAAPGEIQNALQVLTQSRLNYEQAILEYEHHVTGFERLQKKIKDRAAVLERQGQLKAVQRSTIFGMDIAIFTVDQIARVLETTGKETKSIADAASKCPPGVLGLASDVTSPVRCAISIGGSSYKAGVETGILGLEIASDAVDLAKNIVNLRTETILFNESADYELYQLGLQFGGLERQEKELRLAVFMAKDQYIYEQGTYDYFVQQGARELSELIRLRKRWAGQISSQRYNDMAFRIHQNNALQKYRNQFDLAQTYAYLTASAYDYETNLSSNEPASGNRFLRQIVGARSLGELVQEERHDGTVVPIPGAGGLADPLGQMVANFGVLKGQIGFNNPQDEANQFSLRHELFRLRSESDAAWQQMLQRYYKPDIWSNDSVSQLAKRPYGQTGPAPGLVIPFNSTISLEQNFFGRDLGIGDGAYSPSQFSTKIANAGIWLEGYDEERLARTPRVYLIPAGRDVLRPRGSEGEVSYWNVTEQLLPVPHEIGPAELANPSWIPRLDGLSGELYQSKPLADMRAYPLTDDLEPKSLNLDTRLIGRSVWNTEWILVIPGWTLLKDADQGLETFIETVDDIHIYFETYSYAGTAQ